jgi:hypothetical protein
MRAAASLAASRRRSSPRRLDGDLTPATKCGVSDTGMDTLRTRFAFLLASTLLASPGVAAQAPPMRNGLELDSVTFVELQALIASQDSVRVRGSFGEAMLRGPTLTSDSLLAATDTFGTPGPRLHLGDITRIQVRRRASGTGALVGAGVGLAGGAAAAAGLSASLCNDGGCSNQAGGTAVITLGSTAAGALIGAVLGSSFKRWHTVYEAP